MNLFNVSSETGELNQRKTAFGNGPYNDLLITRSRGVVRWILIIIVTCGIKAWNFFPVAMNTLIKGFNLDGGGGVYFSDTI